MRITLVLAMQYGVKVRPLVILNGKDSEIEKKYGFWVVRQLGLVNVF